MPPHTLHYLTFVACLAPFSSASAQLYRVIDLGGLDVYHRDPTVARDLDSFGRVVGRTLGDGHFRPFVWDLGEMTELSRLDLAGNAGATAINDRGVVAGSADASSGLTHAVAWSGAQIIDLGTFGGRESESTAINRSDWVVGWADNNVQLQRGFIFRNNQMTDIGTLPGGSESGAAAIDSFGRVAGWSRDANGRFNAIIWENGLMATLGMLPGARDSFAEAMNDHDQVVGSSDSRAFIFEGDFTGGTMTELPSLGGTRSYAVDINNAGVIIGSADPPVGGLLPCIWLDRQPHDLNEFIAPESGWTVTAARAINDSGYIAAEAKLDNTVRAALLVPTPLHLERPTPGLAGEVNTFAATGASPGAQVRLLYGTQRGYCHPPGCPTAIVEMRQASLAATATADQDGVVTLELFVPSFARGRIFIIQMIEPNGCNLSQPMVTTFR